MLEVTYQVQPTAPCIFNIHGGVLQPESATKRVGDAAVFGARTDGQF